MMVQIMSYYSFWKCLLFFLISTTKTYTGSGSC